jgi:hypothetical protein
VSLIIRLHIRNRLCLVGSMTMRWLLQICFTVMALLASASVSSAASCADDPNECTLKKLCEASTTLDGNNTIWATTSETAKHVALAQSLGMECGVTPIVDLCETDPSECKVSEICEKATTESAGQKTWDDSAAGHVAMAKEYGLSCDVVVEAAVKKTCWATKPAGCTDSDLCSYATEKAGKWQRLSEHQGYVAEAKKRGLTCGVKAKTNAVVDICSAVALERCTDLDLCRRSTGYIGSTGPIKDTKVWSDSKYWANHVKEAKKRGLTCGVGTKATNFKEAFTSQSRLKRQQLQYALQKLGYYSYGIDGLWGKGTSSAFVKFVSGNGLKGKRESQVFSSLLSKVDVPSSFAAPQKKTTASNNSKGWKSFSANPQYSFEQARAICLPQARMAGEQASRSYSSPDYGSSANCSGYGYSMNCNVTKNSGGFWGGVADVVGESFAQRNAENAMARSCMAKYGWTK